ncbi:MAG TPA: hypothetical protein VN622_11050 [Clostridia bacterium]|nr:hypothetical protein [Clostridia bacterium]
MIRNKPCMRSSVYLFSVLLGGSPPVAFIDFGVVRPPATEILRLVLSPVSTLSHVVTQLAAGPNLEMSALAMADDDDFDKRLILVAQKTLARCWEFIAAFEYHP